MEPLLTLERFAALSAEMEAGAPPDAILVREGLSPEQWATFEAMWRARIEEDISYGSFELTNRYNAAFVARRAALRYDTPTVELAAAGGYAAEASMPQGPTTPRMLEAPPQQVDAGMQPPPTPRMLQAPQQQVDAGMQPPPTPRMLQAPPPPSPLPPPAVLGPSEQPIQPAPTTPRMVQAPAAPIPRAGPSYSSAAPPARSSEPPRSAYDLEDSPTPVSETLRPGMALPVNAGDRPTPTSPMRDDLAITSEETPPPSSGPVSTPRQETQEGPRFDGLPFRPAPAGSDVAPRSMGDLSGVLPFKPAAAPSPVSMASPAPLAAPAPAPVPVSVPVSAPMAAPVPVSAPQSPWGSTATGTVKMAVVSSLPAEPETDITGPLSPPPPAPFVMGAGSGPPVLTGPGALTPAPFAFPFSLRRRASDPHAHSAPAPASPAHLAPAPPAHALPPHSVPAHALPAHPPQAQAPQASQAPQAPPARPSQPGFAAVIPVAPPPSPQGLPPINLPPVPAITTAASTSPHLAPVSARQTLPPNVITSSPSLPFKAAPDAPVSYPAQGAGFQQPTYTNPPGAPSQPAGLAVPAVLGASSSRLTLEQYASMSAEVAISPGTSAAVRARYGLDENAYIAETGFWQRRFSADKELFTRYSALYQSYREWFSRSAR